MENEESNEKEVYEVKKRLNTDALQNQIHKYCSDQGYLSLIFLFFIAAMPPVLGVIWVLMAMFADFLFSREKEDIDELIMEIRTRVDNNG